MNRQRRKTSSEGARLFALLTTQPGWIHRRVDRTDLEVDGETTRHISFDLTVDATLAVQRGGGVVVPLTLLTKAPLRRLDARGPDGRPIPVLGRQDNGTLVGQMLCEAFDGVLLGGVTDEIGALVRRVVMEHDPAEMERRVAELQAAVASEAAVDDDQVGAVMALASDLARLFLLAVVIPADHIGRRVIVKVVATEEVTDGFSDWVLSQGGRSMDLAMSQLIDAASSAHFEFRAPIGLRVASVTLLDQLDQEIAVPGPSIEVGRTAHLTGLERVAPPSGTQVRARVELEPVAEGVVSQTAFATTFVGLLLLVAAWRFDLVGDAIQANRGGPLAAVALAVPALFLSVQARAPEHAWVARALFVPRSLNLGTALLLYVLALVVVTAPPDHGVMQVLVWCGAAIQVAIGGAAIALLRRVSVEPPTVTSTG